MKKIFIYSYLFLSFSVSIRTMDQPSTSAHPLQPKLLKTQAVEAHQAVCYTKDGNHLIAGSANKLTVWDTAEYNACITDYKPGVLHIDTSPSEAKQFVVSSSSAPAGIWSLYEERPKLIAFLNDTKRKAEPNINSVQYGCCGKTLLVTNNQSCELWDLDTKKISRIFGSSAGNAVDAQWNPRDQSNFATIAQKETEKEVVSTVIIWDIRAEYPVKVSRTDRAINKIYFNSFGSQLVATAPGQYMICDAKTLALLRCISLEGRERSANILSVLADNTRNANAVQFVPNSNDIFFAGLDDASIVGIDLAENNQPYRFNASEIADEVAGLAINPQNNTMATLLKRSNLVKVWDISNAQALVNEQSKRDDAKEWCSLL